MSRTDELLAQIDDAVHDWSVSPDAMRCGAPPAAPVPAPVMSFRPAPDFSRFVDAVRQVGEAYARAMRPAVAALVKFGEAIRKAQSVADVHHPVSLCIDGHAYHRRTRARRRRR